MDKEKESAKEILLEACGPAKPPPGPPGVLGQQREKYFEAMLARADTAAQLAQQAQGETEKNYQKLNTFLEHQLPGRLQSAFELVAKEQVNKILSPLQSGINRVVSTLNDCTEAAGDLAWVRSMVVVGGLVGLFTVAVGTTVVRCTILDPKFDEARRWEIYGHRVAESIEKFPPKDRENLYKWVGGRP